MNDQIWCKKVKKEIFEDRGSSVLVECDVEINPRMYTNITGKNEDKKNKINLHICSQESCINLEL
jgi:hypothetical protein